MMSLPTLGAILGVSWLDEFDTDAAAFKQRDHIHDLLEAHFSTDTTENWLALLDQHDVWCAPVQDHHALITDPQFTHAGLLWEVQIGDDPAATFKTIGSPFTFSQTPVQLRRGVPRVGQDTTDVLPPVPATVRNS